MNFKKKLLIEIIVYPMSKIILSRAMITGQESGPGPLPQRTDLSCGWVWVTGQARQSSGSRNIDLGSSTWRLIGLYSSILTQKMEVVISWLDHFPCASRAIWYFDRIYMPAHVTYQVKFLLSIFPYLLVKASKGTTLDALTPMQGKGIECISYFKLCI